MEDGSAALVGLYRGGKFFAIHTDHLGTPRLMTNEASTPVWQRPYSAFGMTKPTGVLKATPNPKAAITNKPVLLKATNPAQELNIRESSQYEDDESSMRYNLMRTLVNGYRYSQPDPIGMAGGMSRFASVNQSPLSFTDRMGLAADDHVTGSWKQCSNGCRIRIDWKLVNGVKVRHLHWECKKKEGVGGEYGGESRGETLDGAPAGVKECARKHGFESDPANCPPEKSIYDQFRDVLLPPQVYDPAQDRMVPGTSRSPGFSAIPGGMPPIFVIP